MTPLSWLEQFWSRLSSYAAWEVAVEIVIIWVAVYTVWRFVRGTRAIGAIRGVLLIILLTLAARVFIPSERLQRLAYLYDNFLGFAALAVVIIFQPELRRALIRLGEAPFFRSTPSDLPRIVDALVQACGFLSKNKFGAIIAIERQVGLREVVEGGKILNADLSAELLQSIFWPNNPLHDMGVVVRGGKIAAAGVQFPLADPEDMADARVGTRHRAAVGLSRAVDAVVIVVSEETGAISIAERGKLERWFTTEALRGELLRRLRPQPTQDDLSAPEEAAATADSTTQTEAAA